MYNFNFDMPTKVLFGPGRLNDLHEEKLPGKKALVVTTNGSSVKKNGYLDRVLKELELAGVSYELYPEIRPYRLCVSRQVPVQPVKWTMAR